MPSEIEFFGEKSSFWIFGQIEFLPKRRKKKPALPASRSIPVIGNTLVYQMNVQYEMNVQARNFLKINYRAVWNKSAGWKISQKLIKVQVLNKCAGRMTIKHAWQLNQTCWHYKRLFQLSI